MAFITVVIISVFTLGQSSGPVEGEAGYRENQEAYSVSQQFDDIPKTIEAADSLQNIAESIEGKDPQTAIYAALDALEISKSLNYLPGIANANKILGRMYVILGDHDVALEYLLASLEQNYQLDNDVEIGTVMNAIASIHVLQENYEQAVEYYSEAIEKMKAIGDAETAAILTMNLGVANYYMENFEEALRYYEIAREMTESEVDHPRLHMISITNIGNVLIDLGDYDSAEVYLQQAIDFFEENELNVNLSGTHLYLSKLYHRRGDYEDALIQANFGREIAESIEQSQYTLEAYERLSGIYEEMGDFENAFRYFKIYHEEQQKVFNNERSEQITRLQTQFEVDQKNQEIDLLNKEIELREAATSRQILWRNFLITGVILMSVILILAFRYLSQRKRANNLLNQRKKEIEKQNRQLVQLNEEKNIFLNIAAHDLRGPLTSIVGVADLLKNSDNHTPEEKEQYITIIKDSTSRMLNMINSFLDVKNIENNLNNVRSSVIDVRKPLVNLAKFYRNHARSKNIEVNEHLGDKPVKIFADVDHIRSIFENLLSNAIKFSDSGTEVTIQLETKNKKAIISIIDNGPGITEEDQKKLFGRFNRLSNKPTANEPSIGLGLYIVKNLTVAMNGEIRCESTPGKGSVFIVTFPLAVNEEIEFIS